MSTRSSLKIDIPTAEEDAVITAAAWNDPDNQPLTDIELAQFRQVVGYSNDLVTKVSATVQFDAEVLSAFHASGEEWQTLMNNVLRDWLRSHSPE